MAARRTQEAKRLVVMNLVTCDAWMDRGWSVCVCRTHGPVRGSAAGSPGSSPPPSPSPPGGTPPSSLTKGQNESKGTELGNALE